VLHDVKLHVVILHVGYQFKAAALDLVRAALRDCSSFSGYCIAR